MYYTVQLPTYSECNGSKETVVLPITAYMKRLCPRGEGEGEGGTFFRLKAYERGAKSVILV